MKIFFTLSIFFLSLNFIARGSGIIPLENSYRKASRKKFFAVFAPLREKWLLVFILVTHCGHCAIA
jgi:hypothetical protein